MHTYLFLDLISFVAPWILLYYGDGDGDGDGDPNHDLAHDDRHAKATQLKTCR